MIEKKEVVSLKCAIVSSNRILFFLLLFVALLSPLALGGEIHLAREANPKLTIYNQGVALIREVLAVSLPKGESLLVLEDISPDSIPASIFLRQVDGPSSLLVGQQSFWHTPLSYNNMLRERVGEEITFLFESGEERVGRLLTIRPDLLIQFEDQLLANPKGKVYFSSIPKGMAYRPTIEWLVEAKEEGEYFFELHYLSTGLQWVADYVGIIDGEGKLALQGMITLNNWSQIDFEASQVLVVAGDVNVSAPMEPFLMAETMVLRSDTAPTKMASVGEYYVYRIEGELDLQRDAFKQVSFLTAKTFVDQVFLFPTYVQKGSLLHTITIVNREDRGLGIPLPQGVVRIYQEENGDYFFLGEERIEHTGLLEEERLVLGGSFDLFGERRMVERRQFTRDTYLEKIEIVITNGRDEEASVLIEGDLGRSWRIEESSHPYAIHDVSKILYSLTIPPNEVEVITYSRVSQ